MKINRRILILIVIAIVMVILAISSIVFIQLGVRPSTDPGSMDDIRLPPGFEIDVYARDLGGSALSFPGPNTAPRMMLLKDGILYVSLTRQGKVVALPDHDNDNKADKTIIFLDGLNNPHGLDFYDGWFYIAEENRVIRIQDRDNDLLADRDTFEVLIDDLPTGGHFTRSIRIHNNSLYLSIGSSCNVCNEQDERRAAISRCDLDGTDCEIFARGLRNAVGIVFHPLTGEMYATENGRDMLGDDIPPDEINLVQEGTSYGWPICYGANIHDTQFDRNVYVRNPCEQPFEMPALVDLQAHSAPLGLTFYYGDSFPEQYRGDLFVAFHGSWNRKVPTGYKIVTIDMDDLEVKDFATGWLRGSTVLGRPVDIIMNDEGALFVSDDNAGKIYRIYYQKSGSQRG